MHTFYATRALPTGVAQDLAHDFPDAFQYVGSNTLEILNSDAAFNLTGSVRVEEDGDTLYIVVDADEYPLYEA